MNRHLRRSQKSKRKHTRNPGRGGSPLGEVERVMQDAVTLHQAGRPREALSCYDEVLRLYPAHVDALGNSAVLAAQSGDIEGGIQRARDAITLKPEHVGAHNNLGMILEAVDRLDEAETVLRRALDLAPTASNIHANMGNVLQKLGKYGAAAALYREALVLEPGGAITHNNLGNALRARGENGPALDCFRRAIALDPKFAEAFNNLGIVHQQRDELDDAVENFQRAIALKPDFLQARNNLGNAFRKLSRFDAALGAFKGAVAIDPGNGLAYNEMAFVYHDLGRLDEALAALQRAIEIKPDYAEAHSNLLYLQTYHGVLSHDEVLAEHRLWAQRHAPPSLRGSKLHGNSRTSDRRLRIGYVSGDFREHVVSFFIEPILEQHDKQRVELFCYSTTAGSDRVTDRLMDKSDHWRSLVGIDDERAAEMIRSDAIDIIVDLSGHTAGNRLPLFGRKPAPVQASYLGYFATTGLSTMDYWIVDDIVCPAATPQKTVETLYRLPRCWVCYQPHDDAPEVGPPPSSDTGDGVVTFGSFNNLSKVSDLTIALWARVLLAVPGSRMLLKTKLLAHAPIADRIRADFADHGIEANRLILRGQIAGAANHLALYNQVDIALDTVPFSGGATTLDALWMGVPLITLLGEVHVARMSAALLTTMDRPEWIAADEAEFIAKAVAPRGRRRAAVCLARRSAAAHGAIIPVRRRRHGAGHGRRLPRHVAALSRGDGGRRYGLKAATRLRLHGAKCRRMTPQIWPTLSSLSIGYMGRHRPWS